MRTFAVLLGCCVLAPLLVADAARGEIVAHLSSESEIRAYGGVAVVSELHADTRRYRLMRVHRDGRVVPLPGVPSRARPFDADVGPDSRGRPVVAYSRGGDLFLHRIGGRGEEPIRTASTRGWYEREPTIWRGRVAWSVARGLRTAVLTRSRLASRRVRAERVIGWDDGLHEVTQLELRGRDLASVIGRLDAEASSARLRLHRIGRRHARVLRRTGFGMSGTEIVGPTFAGHRLGWLVACFGDPSGCTRGPSTFDLRTRRTTTERGYRPRTGYAFVRGGTLEVGGGGFELGDDAYEQHEEPGYANPCATDDETATCPVILRP